jgi:hypothetical protein
MIIYGDVGHVLNVIEEKKHELKFLHYHSPSVLTIYPATSDILWLPQSAALTKNTPNVIGGMKKTPWSESASELYQPSNRHLSAK